MNCGDINTDVIPTSVGCTVNVLSKGSVSCSFEKGTMMVRLITPSVGSAKTTVSAASVSADVARVCRTDVSNN